jgi:hypothetical protein
MFERLVSSSVHIILLMTMTRPSTESRSLTAAEPLLIVSLPSKIVDAQTMIARVILNPR